MSTIQCLVERVKSGEPGATEHLVQRLITRLRPEEWRIDRDELHQEAAACALESLTRGELARARDPEARLARRFRNRLRRRLYARRRDARSLPLGCDPVAALAQAARLDLRAVPPRLWSAMRHLTPPQRVVMWATHWDEKRDAEVARDAGTSRQNVVALRLRAYSVLRYHLEG